MISSTLFRAVYVELIIIIRMRSSRWWLMGCVSTLSETEQMVFFELHDFVSLGDWLIRSVLFHRFIHLFIRSFFRLGFRKLLPTFAVRDGDIYLGLFATRENGTTRSAMFLETLFVVKLAWLTINKRSKENVRARPARASPFGLLLIEIEGMYNYYVTALEFRRCHRVDCF